jgi:hypothetical protein
MGMGVATNNACHGRVSCASTTTVLSAGAMRSTKKGLRTRLQRVWCVELRISLTSWIGSVRAFASCTTVLDDDTFVADLS